MGQVIVSVDVTDKGRVATSFVTKNRRRNKNGALTDLKNHIKNAKEILYIKDRQTGHPLQSTSNEASTVDANLHFTSQFILPQFFEDVKKI